MTYKESIKHSLTVRWKTETCTSGEKCWCRIISPETEILDNDGNEIYIAGSGVLDRIYAEYIVKIHNEHINNL